MSAKSPDSVLWNQKISLLMRRGRFVLSPRMFDPRKVVACVLAALLQTITGMSAEPVEVPAAKMQAPPPDAPERIELCRVQVFLDRAGFRPGKIDGLGGEFTQKAADRYCDSVGVARGTMLDVSSVSSPYREYVISEDDAAWVGPVSSEPSAQAKLKSLKYGTLWEAVAERFHCDQKFLVELNPHITEPAVGSVLRVPDVKEFLLSDVKALQKERATKGRSPVVAASLPPPPPPLPLPASYDLSKPIQPSPIEQTPAPTPTPQPTPVATPEPKRSLVLLRSERLIEVYEEGRIVACFPCTPGSAKIPVPLGTWKITSNILLPHFRWDKSVLESGVRSENAFMLPPGPNSPVGIVWMGINRPSIGMHGTNTPDRIGRNESSGCIRLANWDAFTLCQLVKPGTTVEVR
jgi:lipoprotein-anchoring transpeptidase ErfK/SrfK